MQQTIEELTAEMLNELVDKSIVHAPDKSSGRHRQKTEIYSTKPLGSSTLLTTSVKLGTAEGNGVEIEKRPEKAGL